MFALLTLAVALGGCNPSKPSGMSFEELKPTQVAYSEANLYYTGTEVPVEVVTSNENGLYRIRLTAFGEVIETEEYQVDGQSFAMARILGENYTPPMTLLKNPVSEGKSNWKGRMESGGIGRDASAEITVSKGKTPAQEGVATMQAIIATVDLSIGEAGQPPSKRTLKFYFVPGKGLLYREFGAMGSRRVPIVDDAASLEAP
jgi:hypothetical protein